MKALRSRLARLALVAVLVLPLGISASAIPASAAWYYKSFTDTVSMSYGGSTFYSTAEFTIGYNSAGYPYEVDVTKYTDTVYFQKCTSPCPITHSATEGYGCNPWHESYAECGSWPWDHRSTVSCTSTASSGCTLSRIEQPRLWMPWYPASATASYWVNVSSYFPGDDCNFIHMFNPAGTVNTTSDTAHDLDHACLTGQ
ncbi:MAG: hypothetical protein QOJ10_1391 [Chloroflexota bacterium]|nr:hypothetical protein [Chloroflexota bacterium]